MYSQLTGNDDSKYRKRRSSFVEALRRLTEQPRIRLGILLVLGVFFFVSVLPSSSSSTSKSDNLNSAASIMDRFGMAGFRGTMIGGSVPETEEEMEDAAASEEDEGEFAEQEEEQQEQALEEEAAAEAAEDGELVIVDKPFEEYGMEELYENHEELKDCPYVKLPRYMKRANDWWGLKTYMNMYQEHPIKSCVPVLRPQIKLNPSDFKEHYRRWGRPLLFHFDNIRHLGFNMKSYSLDELEQMFPFNPAKDQKIEYEANRKYSKEQEIDLGPAIHSFKQDGELVRKKGGKRNFPRNMKVKAESMKTLGVEIPPLLEGVSSSQYQTPSLWMGTSTSGTQFHHDCCDNFVMMIFGSKRFTLAPTTDWQPLKPRCVGKMKSLCYANIAEPIAESYDHFSKMMVDVKPGQILYMPAGWFHHIENLGPTLMVNVWTRGKVSFFLFFLDLFIKFCSSRPLLLEYRRH